MSFEGVCWTTVILTPGACGRGESCTYQPVVNADDEIQKEDIVLCEVQPGNRFYAHIVKKIEDWEGRRCFTIANYAGRENGWCYSEHIYGKLIHAEQWHSGCISQAYCSERHDCAWEGRALPHGCATEKKNEYKSHSHLHMCIESSRVPNCVYLGRAKNYRTVRSKLFGSGRTH